MFPIDVRPPGLEPGTHWLRAGDSDDAVVIPFPGPLDAPQEAGEHDGEVILLPQPRERGTSPLDHPGDVVDLDSRRA
ncbi:hypothetical protein [Sinomonas sp. ASV322]|uniref:hypothetical protein n=1 Tax=Sinomonas sp. ASV322 TaxID=3041920 RepID=UPI0027DC66B8|nr:hypothetical protein [Sinomonas sp. ASV322]MDQ4502209.1 hypothetical protein [Sinomonas sp. ASV322]